MEAGEHASDVEQVYEPYEGENRVQKQLFFYQTLTVQSVQFSVLA